MAEKTKKFRVNDGEHLFDNNGEKRKGGEVIELTAKQMKKFAAANKISPHFDEDEDDDAGGHSEGREGRTTDGDKTAIGLDEKVHPVGQDGDDPRVSDGLEPTGPTGTATPETSETRRSKPRRAETPNIKES